MYGRRFSINRLPFVTNVVSVTSVTNVKSVTEDRADIFDAKGLSR